MKTVIFDLDGTLALIEKRRALANQSGKFNWDVFFTPENIRLDEPNWPVIRTCQALQKDGYRIVIFSGRDDITRDETQNWLEKYGVVPSAMVMRKHGDYTPDDVLKKQWLDSLFPNKGDVLCTFDDRDKVVSMWRREGLTCFQVAPGEF